MKAVQCKVFRRLNSETNTSDAATVVSVKWIIGLGWITTERPEDDMLKPRSVQPLFRKSEVLRSRLIPTHLGLF